MCISKGFKALGSAIVPILIFSQTAMAAPSIITYQNAAGQNVQVNYLVALTHAPMKTALMNALSSNELANLPIFVTDDNGSVINYIDAIRKSENYAVALTDSSVNHATAPVSTYQMDADGAVTPVVTLASVSGVVGTTTVGTAYALPATVTATMSDGTIQSVAVTWDAVDASKYAAVGSYIVSGTIAGSATVKATATVTVNAASSIGSSVSSINVTSGTAKIGVELTAGTLTPAGATASYQWQICASAVGAYANIAGATTNKYTPVAGDVTKFIKVVATGIGSYSGTVTSSATGAVAKADGPALLGVTMDDNANTVSGMSGTMEFSTNGTAWTAYNQGTPNLPDLTGTVALQVRVAATATSEVGPATTFNFTQVGTAPVNLGTAGNYVILSKTGISTVPPSVITGDIGVSPAAATYITGFSLTADATNVFSTSPQITGKAYASNYASTTPSNLTTAISNMETAYVDAAGRTANFNELYTGDISGQTLTPGVYKWGTGVLITSDVTLHGGPNDVWIFQIAKGITQANGTRITLTGGAQAKNIFWQSAETVSIGTGAHFEGILLAMTKITAGTNSSINGRLLAQTAVTLDATTVVAP